MGRRKGKAYEELNFKLVKVNNRSAAFCNICKKNLCNTAAARLRGHRNRCRIGNENYASSPKFDSPSESNTSVIYISDEGNNGLFSEPDELFINMENSPRATQNVESSSEEDSLLRRLSPSYQSTSEQLPLHHSFARSRKRRKRAFTERKTSTSITDLADGLSQKEEDEINESLTRFFIACNIPLSVVNSVYFRNFVDKIRPAYGVKIPKIEVLSTKLLDNSYEKCISWAKYTMSLDSVLLIDSWQNSSNNYKTFVSILHNANGEQAFLEAWDISEEDESAEKFAAILSESVDLAENMYATRVYAVVSDYDANISKVCIWKSSCNCHTGNLLAKDVSNSELHLKVTAILKEYKKPDLEKKVVEKGGTRIKLPCETRFTSYRHAYNCLIENVDFMKLVAADSDVKPDVVTLLFNSQFINDVKSNIELLNPICNLISKCQSPNCSAAEAVDMWLDLRLPEKFSKQFQLRQEIALNQYALSAFFLHPFTDNAKLNSVHNSIIFEFLFDNLSGTGIEEWDSFKNKLGFFKKLYEKNIKNPLVFWNMAETKYPTLAKLAKQLLQIPASSAQIGKILSSWSHIHSAARNRLTFEQSKKLLHIYCSLRIKDIADSEEECDIEYN